MSIAGYFGSRKPALRIPKKSSDKLGVRFEGPVVTGEKTVEEQLASDGVRQVLPGDEYCESVEDYDPVLRAHCRL